MLVAEQCAFFHSGSILEGDFTAASTNMAARKLFETQLAKGKGCSLPSSSRTQIRDWPLRRFCELSQPAYILPRGRHFISRESCGCCGRCGGWRWRFSARPPSAGKPEYNDSNT